MAKQKAVIAPVFLRVKAFIVDMFFIAMPLFYITTYLVLGSKEAFWQSSLSQFLIWTIYAIITSIFISKSAQTPGYKAQSIYLIDLKNGQKLSFFRAFLRFLCFVIAGFSIVGLFLCFFRKDRLNLHDILTQSAAVSKKNETK